MIEKKITRIAGIETKIKVAPECHSSGRIYPTIKEIEKAAEDIATIMHNTLCRYNHTDGCSFEIYDKNWEMGSRLKWKQIAIKMLDNAYNY